MRKFVLAAALVLMASGAQAATLNVIGGILHGASDVLVDGSLYDVQFLDGTCIDLYDGCDEASDFTFHTLESALLASQALLDQVFLDNPSGFFDTVPDLTNGCTGFEECHVATPWHPFLYTDAGPDVGALAAYVAVSYNGSSSADRAWYGPGSYIFGDFLPGPSVCLLCDPFWTYGVWSVSQVPEPSTALLLGIGLTGLAAQGRRRNRS